LGQTYRLKVGDIPDYPSTELYPTLQLPPSHPGITDFIDHSAIPIEFSADEIREVCNGIFLTKVVVLLPSGRTFFLSSSGFGGPSPSLVPDPKKTSGFKALEKTEGLGELVQTRLEDGVDPVAEAKECGYILAVIRVGNIDREAP